MTGQNLMLSFWVKKGRRIQELWGPQYQTYIDLIHNGGPLIYSFILYGLVWKKKNNNYCYIQTKPTCSVKNVTFLFFKYILFAM